MQVVFKGLGNFNYFDKTEIVVIVMLVGMLSSKASGTSTTSMRQGFVVMVMLARRGNA